MKTFEPEFAGKMNFYLSAVDDQLRYADDKPSIGLLCKERDHVTSNHALRDLKKAHRRRPMADETGRIPASGILRGSLPTVAEIEAESLTTTHAINKLAN